MAKCQKMGGVVVAAAVVAGVSLLPGALGQRVRDLALSGIGLGLLYAACRGCFAGYSSSRAPTASQDVDLADSYRQTVCALSSAIAAKESWSESDSLRVQQICDVLSREMGLGRHEREGISLAALLRDTGKLGVPDHILLKPGPLDDSEFDRMRNHAAIGADLIKHVQFPWDISPMIRHHHEHYDGTGYPDGLSGEDIPLGARVLAVADAYDAMVSERCYRKGWRHWEAAEHIHTLSGTAFDPKVVEAFEAVSSAIAGLTPQVRPAEEEHRGAGSKAADMISQANRELVSLYDVAQTLSGTLEIDEVVALLAGRSLRLCQAAACAVFVVDEADSSLLTARAAAGRGEKALMGATARFGKGVTGKSAQRQAPYMCSYDPQDLTFPARAQLAFKSCIVLPIVSRGVTLGTLNAYSAVSNAFKAEDMRLLSFVARQAAVAIENARTFERVRDSAMRDSLTNLHNGRYLRSCLEHELSRAERFSQPLSVLAIDLDNFKAVNDAAGHAVGDEVLRCVADIFRMHIRDYDVAARNGGDEFVVVLPGATADEARLTADRIQQNIEQYARASTVRSTAMLGASVGLATYPDDAGDPEKLLAAADAAMYEDKRARKQGRLAA